MLVNETDSGRVLLVKYIHICIRFFMYQTLFWQLNLVSTIRWRFFNIWWSKVLILILGQLMEYYIQKIFIEKFRCPNTNFGPLHWPGGSLAYLMLITVLSLIWSKDHREPWNEDESQSLAKYIYKDDSNQEPFDPELMQWSMVKALDSGNSLEKRYFARS